MELLLFTQMCSFLWLRLLPALTVYMSNMTGILYEAGTVYLSSPPISSWGPYRSSFQLFVLSYFLSLRSEFCVVMALLFPHKTTYVSSLPPVVCWKVQAYLRCLCLFVHSGVQCISCCVFSVYFLRLVFSMLPVSLSCPF